MGIKRTVSIRLIDYKKEKVFTGSKLNKKCKKTKIENFPLYFWSNSFVKKNWKFTVEEIHQFRN